MQIYQRDLQYTYSSTLFNFFNTFKRPVAREPEADTKYPRKNISRSVKTGYKGVIQRRNSKYIKMKDLYMKELKKKKFNSKSTKTR